MVIGAPHWRLYVCPSCQLTLIAACEDTSARGATSSRRRPGAVVASDRGGARPRLAQRTQRRQHLVGEQLHAAREVLVAEGAELQRSHQRAQPTQGLDS